MSTGLAHYPIFGTDLVVIIGITALILFIFVASIKSLNRLVLKKRDKNIPHHWHHWIAISAIVWDCQVNGCVVTTSKISSSSRLQI